ncbi:conserved hypothetical protein [Rubrivivax sp. A210]|uniref:hypothetical protein n=1 Tax=Rubrivivax sp. A210 TaxID=2772301 RepID=UPI0019187E7B|nr:hypothetical protein [Rubrivivax sp. A210]CAD5370289.1 conserved hypothetical protein [Rubrivivax sp. A210]
MSTTGFWQQQALRIDARTLRERVFIFLSAALVLVAAADALLLTPLFSDQKQLRAQMQAQTAELATLRAAAAASGPDAGSPRGRLQAALRAAREERVRTDAAIAQAQAGQQPTQALADLVERALRRHERLALVHLKLAVPRPLAPGSAVVLQGVELSVAGRYPDLLAYLAALEQALPALRWGELSLVEGTPPTLTVQIHTLGGSP